jgi:hypothetical protein
VHVRRVGDRVFQSLDRDAADPAPMTERRRGRDHEDAEAELSTFGFR